MWSYLGRILVAGVVAFGAIGLMAGVAVTRVEALLSRVAAQAATASVVAGKAIITFYWQLENSGVLSRDEAQQKAKASLAQLPADSAVRLWTQQSEGWVAASGLEVLRAQWSDERSSGISMVLPEWGWALEPVAPPAAGAISVAAMLKELLAAVAPLFLLVLGLLIALMARFAHLARKATASAEAACRELHELRTIHNNLSSMLSSMRRDIVLAVSHATTQLTELKPWSDSSRKVQRRIHILSRKLNRLASLPSANLSNARVRKILEEFKGVLADSYGIAHGSAAAMSAVENNIKLVAHYLSQQQRALSLAASQ